MELSLAMSRIGGVGGAGLGSLDNPKLLASCRKVPIRFSFFSLPVVQVVQGVRCVTTRVVAVPRTLAGPAYAVQTGDLVPSVSPSHFSARYSRKPYGSGLYPLYLFEVGCV